MKLLKKKLQKRNNLRGSVKGTIDQPRLSVFRSNQHIYAQIIDDVNLKTLVSCSSLDPEIKVELKNGKTCSASKIIGQKLAERSLQKNIKKISEKIGLGLKNILFVDDNPVERDQVKQFLPDVKVLDLPDDPIEYIDCLLSSPYLEVHKITESDKNRTNTYQKKVIVDKLKEDYGSNKEDFYKHLELEIYINNLTNENKDRCIQLLNKTNQFNTTTLRLTENDILTNNYKVYVLGAKDKYNDYENMGVLVTKELGDTLEIIDYLLSCRFLGKNLGNL